MKYTIAWVLSFLALTCGAINITNYPTTNAFSAGEWFFLSSVPLKTNFNLPGNYVASTANLNAASNSVLSQMTNTVNSTSNSILAQATNAPVTYVSNFTSTTVITTNLYVSNIFVTNFYALTGGVSSITVSNTLSASNILTGWLTVSNTAAISNATIGWLTVSNTAVVNQLEYYTNLCTMAPDFAKGYCWISTNAAFTFLNPLNIDATGTRAQTTVMIVTNSSGSTILSTAPANVHVVPGSVMYITNATAFTWFLYPLIGTNVYGVPLF